MAQMNGKYEFARNENFPEYLQALGVTVDQDKINTGALTVNVDGNKGTITTESFNGVRVANFTFGEAFEESFGADIKVQSVATTEGSKITVVSKAGNGNEHTRTYEFADRGCKLTMSSTKTDLVGIRYYKRA